jgi:hypothetical protein
VIKFDDQTLHNGLLETVKNFKIEPSLTVGQHTITVELCNKTDANTGLDFDQAVEITGIMFDNIGTDRFVWAGEYTPCYPELWASQQLAAGYELKPVLTGCNYLGWNGQWCLTFTAPVFNWIHQIEHLGWRYD